MKLIIKLLLILLLNKCVIISQINIKQITIVGLKKNYNKCEKIQFNILNGSNQSIFITGMMAYSYYYPSKRWLYYDINLYDPKYDMNSNENEYSVPITFELKPYMLKNYVINPIDFNNNCWVGVSKQKNHYFKISISYYYFLNNLRIKKYLDCKFKILNY